MTDTLKVLAFSDIHGDTRLLEKLHQRAEEENVDLVLICGDFTAPGEVVPRGIVQPFLDLGKRVLVLHGNHESNTTVNFVSALYDIKNLHGTGLRYKHVGVFGCGSANIGLFQLDDQDTFNTLQEGHNRIKYLEKKLMATHVHPSHSRTESIFGFEGSRGVRHAISVLKPDILVCGHIHEAEGMEEEIDGTRVINVSKGGKVFEI